MTNNNRFHIFYCCFVLFITACGPLKKAHKCDCRKINIEQYVNAYWAKDVLSSNGFKALMSIEFLNNKTYFIGKSEMDINNLLGKPYKRYTIDSTINVEYKIIDSNTYANDTYLVFVIDQKTLKVRELYISHEDG